MATREWRQIERADTISFLTVFAFRARACRESVSLKNQTAGFTAAHNLRQSKCTKCFSRRSICFYQTEQLVFLFLLHRHLKDVLFGHAARKTDLVSLSVLWAVPPPTPFSQETSKSLEKAENFVFLCLILPQR